MFFIHILFTLINISLIFLLAFCIIPIRKLRCFKWSSNYLFQCLNILYFLMNARYLLIHCEIRYIFSIASNSSLHTYEKCVTELWCNLFLFTPMTFIKWKFLKWLILVTLKSKLATLDIFFKSIFVWKLFRNFNRKTFSI